MALARLLVCVFLLFADSKQIQWNHSDSENGLSTLEMLFFKTSTSELDDDNVLDLSGSNEGYFNDTSQNEKDDGAKQRQNSSTGKVQTMQTTLMTGTMKSSRKRRSNDASKEMADKWDFISKITSVGNQRQGISRGHARGNSISTMSNKSTSENAGTNFNDDLCNGNDVCSKSQMYMLIVESLSQFSTKYELSYRSCMNKCGTSFECSCKPFCKILKTCCIDYEEACGDANGLSQKSEDYGWLNHVETECFYDTIIVSSCNIEHDENARRESTTRGFDQEGYFPSNSSRDIHEDEILVTGEESNMTIMDMLLLLTTHTERSPLSDAEIALASSPILDTSTGITYKNISIYACNGAHFRFAKFWSIAFPTPEKSLFSDLQEVPDIFKLADFSYTCPLFSKIMPVALYEKNVECCRPEAIRSCPDDFDDIDVKNACENVQFLISVQTTLKNSSKVTIIYGSPFCLACNLRNEDTIDRIKPLRYGLNEKTHCLSETMNLKLDFDLKNIKPKPYDFSITKKWFNRMRIEPMWNKLTCRLIWPTNYLSQDTNAGLISEQSNNITVLGSHCQISGCYPDKGYDRNYTICSSLVAFFMYLPPTRHDPGDRLLKTMLAKWVQILVDNIPNAVPANRYNDFRRYSNYVQLDIDPDYDFLLQGSLYSEIFPSSKLNSLLQDPVMDMFNNSSYPFIKEQNHVCFQGYLIYENPKPTPSPFGCHLIYIPYTSSCLVIEGTIALTIQFITITIIVVDNLLSA